MQQPFIQPRASTLKTGIFITIAVLANSFGNLLLAIGMDRMPDFDQTSLPHYLLLLLINPFLIPGSLLSTLYQIAQLSLFSWADLSFVVPLIASSYIVTTLLGQLVLGEQVDATRWLGVVLISAGVALISRTPTRTADKSAVKIPC
ncbi:MAG TPA: EamA family transporter [Silvibacterium sp.]|nr:EamA family transporter [Silvibacterium sp.]